MAAPTVSTVLTRPPAKRLLLGSWHPPDREEDRQRRSSSVDVLFLIDATVSMAGMIAAAKNKIMDITSQIQQEQQLELRAGLVAYRDMKDTHEVCQFTYDIPALKEQISNVQADGGSDTAEDIFGALEIACVMDWRSRVRTLINIGDAPCHGRRYHSIDDYYPDGDPEVQLYHFLHLNSSTDEMLRKFKAATTRQPGAPRDWITDVGMNDLQPDFMKQVLSAVRTSMLRLPGRP